MGNTAVVTDATDVFIMISYRGSEIPDFGTIIPDSLNTTSVSQKERYSQRDLNNIGNNKISTDKNDKNQKNDNSDKNNKEKSGNDERN